MKIILVLTAIISVGTMASFAQSSGSAPASSSRRDIVPLPSIKSLTPMQAAGKKLFVQRCGICHLPPLPSYKTYGPVLDAGLIDSLGDAATRKQISDGSPRMPGFRYTLSSAEIDEIVVYLRALHLPQRDSN